LSFPTHGTGAISDAGSANALQELPYDTPWEVYFDDRGSHDRVARLKQLQCVECGWNECNKKINKLKEHVETAHGLHFCDVCLASRKVFPCEQRLYTSRELQRHMKLGDPDDPELYNKGDQRNKRTPSWCTDKP